MNRPSHSCRVSPNVAIAAPHPPTDDQHREPVPVDASLPAREHPAEERTDRGAASEQSGGAGVAAVPEDGDGREQGAGLGQDHARRSRLKKVIRR